MSIKLDHFCANLDKTGAFSWSRLVKIILDGNSILIGCSIGDNNIVEINNQNEADKYYQYQIINNGDVIESLIIDEKQQQKSNIVCNIVKDLGGNMLHFVFLD